MPKMTPEQARAALATMTDTDFQTVPLKDVYDEDGHPITNDSIDRLVDASHQLLAERGRPST